MSYRSHGHRPPIRTQERTTTWARSLASAILLSTLAGFPALGQPPGEDPPGKAELLVLGVFHMANPGNDVFNTEVDDVLSATRQREIAEVLSVLERFRPTKVAVEAPFHDSRIARRYDDYRNGSYELGRNEIEQIGFMLAARLGHDTVWPVDADGEFPYLRLVKFAEATGRSDEFEALSDEVRQTVEAQNEFLASHSILDTLLFVNSDQSVEDAMGVYFRYARFGEPWDWAGADLLADWFRRNMRIYSNLVQLIEHPGERILVVYGSGHLGWLRLAAENDPSVRLRTLDELVP